MIRKRFSPLRLLGGILMILFTGGLIAGCTYASGHGGLYYLLIAIPGFGLGFGMIFRPFKLVCGACNVGMKRRCSIPFSLGALPYVTAAAKSGDARALDELVRGAPIPDGMPYAFCAMELRACPQCGQAATLTVHTYKTTKAGPLFDKTVVDFGAGVGQPTIATLEQAGASRWAWTKHQRGFGDPGH